MSFIQLHGIANVKEAKHAPEERYDLVITSAQLKDSKKEDDAQNILVILEIENTDEKYAPIFHYVALPRGKDAAKDQQMLLMAKRFFVQFGIPFDNGVEIEQFVGCRSAGNLKVDEYPEGSGNKKNVLQLDRLPSED